VFEWTAEAEEAF
jgi:hypothetical protein